MKIIKADIPLDYAFVPGMRVAIARIAANFGFDERECYQIETVVDEICNNAIEHGSGGKDEKFDLKCGFDKNKMELTVRDSGGKEFNVEKIFGNNLKLLQEEIAKGMLTELRRGRGLIIVKKLVDKLDIQTGKKGTMVKIVKKKQLS